MTTFASLDVESDDNNVSFASVINNEADDDTDASEDNTDGSSVMFKSPPGSYGTTSPSDDKTSSWFEIEDDVDTITDVDEEHVESEFWKSQ
jgi:hypothetical protein